MYKFTCTPSMQTVTLFTQSAEATAPKPKTEFDLRTCKTLVRAVKLTVIIMLVGLLQVSARTTAQTRISITLRGVTLEKVFSEIEKRSGYTVFYNTEVLKTAGSGLVSLNMKDATIDDVMRECLKGLPLEFSIQDKTVFVKKEARRAVIEPLTGPGSPIPSTFSGIVRNETGAPLMGASVYVLKLKKTLMTDKDGEFTLKDVADGEYEVIITFVGYENFRTKVLVQSHEAWLNADLKQSMSKLDETVVKGYYSTTNRLNTGDVTTVKGEDIQKQPVSDPILALEGRVPGLYIQQTSGIPGAYGAITIRGQNSIANGNDPLYIVDGVPFSSLSMTSYHAGGGAVGEPYGVSNVTGGQTPGLGMSPFNSLNPADIESIEVLKDADATAIYGSRGANGVILITTKRGKAGKTRFDMNIYTGGGKVTRKMHLLNTQQYMQMRREAFNNDGLPFPSLAADSTDYNYDIDGFWDTTRYTNWQKVLIGNTANFTNAQGSLSGGSANTQFVLGGGYSKQGTVYPGSYSDQKASVHFNLTHASQDQRFHAQFSVSYVNDNSNLPQSDLTGQITLAPDSPPLYDANGNLNFATLDGTGTFSNPLAATYYRAKAITDNLIGNLKLTYEILHGLQIRTNLGYNHAQMNESMLEPSADQSPPYNIPYYAGNIISMTDFKTWIIEPQIDFRKKIARGEFDALIGSTFQENDRQSYSESAFGFTSDALITNPLAASTFKLTSFNSVLYRYEAAYSRLSYNWEDKYLINFTARRDGSSRFGPGKQFGDFGAIGAGWIFSKENLIQNDLPYLSFGKIRTSYGTTGNDQITDYQYLSTYSANSTTYQGITGLSPTGLTNPYFAWEVVKKLEVGLELGFLKDRILLSTSYFRDRTGNQLVGYSLPLVTGFSSVQFNLPAVVQNTGVELTLNTINIKSGVFTWTTSVNLTIPNNKLVSFPNIANFPAYINTYVVGKPLSIQEKYYFTGVNPQTGLYSFATKNANGLPSIPNDLYPTKPITQKYYGGVSNSVSYKGFQLDFLVQYVKQVGHSYLAYFGAPGTFNNNQPTAVLSRWQKPSNLTNIQEFSTDAGNATNIFYGYFQGSNATITDASFLRLKNLALSYEMPANWKARSHFQSARLYLQCQNLFTITHYVGLDPETGGINLPPLRMITAGLQLAL